MFKNIALITALSLASPVYAFSESEANIVVSGLERCHYLEDVTRLMYNGYASGIPEEMAVTAVALQNIRNQHGESLNGVELTNYAQMTYEMASRGYDVEVIKNLNVIMCFTRQ